MRTVEEVMKAGELYIAYQPVVDLKRKEVFAYEALVRSHAEEFPNPFVLIEAAVEQRAMGQLGRHLRKLAVDGCPTHRLFLNVHPDEFSEPWLVRPDDSITTHSREIYLEITESVPLSHYEHCHSVLAEMRTRGAKIAVDDLGAGYSNLKYIVDLEPEVVKLDRELVANLKNESRLSLMLVCTSARDTFCNGLTPSLSILIGRSASNAVCTINGGDWGTWGSQQRFSKVRSLRPMASAMRSIRISSTVSVER